MISVIIPVYKVEEYLKQCLDSVLAQTYTELEILLIDDGSPDGCGAICDEYASRDGRIRVFHTENRGLAAARNLGLEHARGEYFGFVDSDDRIEPDMYELLLKKAEETGADLCKCGFWKEDGDSSEEVTLTETVYDSAGAFSALLDGNVRSYVWNKLYRSAAFEGIRFPEGRLYEDILYICSILYASRRIAVIPSAEYHYRRRAGSISKTVSARALVDLAFSRVERYRFMEERLPSLVSRRKEDVLKTVASPLFRLWRSFSAFPADEKRCCREEMRELCLFTRENIPLFGCRSWPKMLRLASPFMRSSAPLSFACLNFMYRAAVKLSSLAKRGKTAEI